MSVHPDDLDTLHRDQLIALWKEFVSPQPPKKISRRLLISTIGFELQLRAASSASRRTYKAIQKEALAPTAKPAAAQLQLHQPGTRLLRQWNGRTHIVDITDEGCVWNGASYRSLTAVARAITGTHWSGPRFFKPSQTASPLKGIA